MKELVEMQKRGEAAAEVSERLGEIGLEFYLSMLPLKFKDLPLVVVLDLNFCTSTKLNVSRNGTLYLIEEDELSKPEWHSLRFEGLVGRYTNSVSDIVKIRDKFKQQAARVQQGLMPDVEEWTITNLD